MNPGNVSTAVVWAPQEGPQKAFIDCPLPEILFGGARGGGKTEGVLGKWAIKADRYGAAFNAVYFRKEMPQQDDVVERAKAIYLPLDARWSDYRRQFRFAAGGRLRFRPLESMADAEKYQGQNLTDAAVEEAGNYPDPAPIDRLFGALRSVEGVPVQLVLTANPGGPGHQWLKRRFIDPAPLGMKVLRRGLPNGAVHRAVYIPSRVRDNRRLLAADPGYIDRLYLVGSEALVKAWLDGDWSVVLGAYFDCWSTARHVIEPLALPAHWTRFRSFDWGSARPFSVGWWAVATEDRGPIRKGCLVRYREWYGATEPNKGLKLDAEDVAKGIVARTDAAERIVYGVADPSCWKVDGGPSIAERMLRHGAVFRRADNGRLNGWDQLRARLVGEDGQPMVLCFSTCVDSIRTIPALQHDEHKPEDVDTEGEDHAGDDWRYACMSRPYTKPEPGTPPIEWDRKTTFDDAFGKLADLGKTIKRERF